MGNKMDDPNLSGASAPEAHGGIAGGFSAAGSSVGAAPESGAQIGQKHQGADRPAEDPATMDPTGGHDINSASAGTDAMAREVDGGHVPGLHYREGNAGHSSSSASQDVHQQRTRSLLPPMEGEDEEARHKRIAASERRRESDANSKTKAATVPVKSTGLAADGGDFDATKPGAGREADRLMEQKGIQRSEDGSGQGDGHGNDGGKAPLGTRIKEKLFTGSHGP